MSEHDMRTLLRDLAMRPEPASTIDITAARRSGKRRLWARRGALSVGVAAVLAAAVVVPQAVFSAAPGSRTVTPAASSTGKPKASDYLNPLVPYAAFGYLPQGYKIGLDSADHDGFVSTVDQLTLTAVQTNGPNAIELDVMRKGGCGDSSVLLDQIPGFKAAHRNAGLNCSEGSATGATRAPDVNGRPAYSVLGGAGFAWEYAPDSWATLEALHGSRSTFPIAEAKALLPKMAAAVKFGQTKPILFPFQLTSAVPASWHPVSVKYTVTSTGQYFAHELGVGQDSANDQAPISGLNIYAAQTPGWDGNTCPMSNGGTPMATSTVQKDGASWVIGHMDKAKVLSGVPADKMTAAQKELDAILNDQACTLQPDNGIFAYITLRSITGTAPVGGIKTILNQLTLSANPQTWTTTPVAS